MTAQITIRDYENLSAYLDGQLSNKEKASLEERMRTNPDLRRAFDEMSRMRSLLRSAPRHRAPRNFTLTPAMVGAQKRKPGGLFGYFPVLSFASAVATMALALTFIFSSGPAPISTASVTLLDQTQPAAAQSQMKAAEGASDTNGEFAPLAAPSVEMANQPDAYPVPERVTAGQTSGGVVTWGFPPNSYSSTGKMPMGGGAIGRGGGGGGGGDMGDLGSTAIGPNGQMVVPYDSAQSLPQAESAAPSAQVDNYADIPNVEGAGPILGVPAEGQGGQYLNPLPTSVPALDQESRPPDEGQQELDPSQPGAQPTLAENESQNSGGLFGLSPLSLVQILLGLLAVVTGILAWWIWKKNR